MSLDMDSTTVAGPQVRAWELLANLADSGQESETLHDAQSLVRCAVDVIRSHLACPWGLLLLHTIVDGPVRASWGLDDVQLQDLLARNGLRSADDMTEVALQFAGAPVGVLLLGNPREADALLPPSFLQALRGQLELLIALQQREATYRREAAALQAAASLSFDLFGQTDLRTVLRSLVERAVTIARQQLL